MYIGPEWSIILFFTVFYSTYQLQTHLLIMIMRNLMSPGMLWIIHYKHMMPEVKCLRIIFQRLKCTIVVYITLWISVNWSKIDFYGKKWNIFSRINVGQITLVSTCILISKVFSQWWWAKCGKNSIRCEIQTFGHNTWTTLDISILF